MLVACLAPVAAAQETAPPIAAASQDDMGYVEGRILQVVESDGAQGRALVRLNDGRVLEASLPASDPYGPTDLPSFAEGDRVELYYAPGPDGERRYVVADWVRRPALIALVGLFLLASVAVARFKGLRAFLSTGASLAIVIGFVVPRIVDGGDPIVISLLGVGGILLLAIWFVHGVSWSTTAALTGTFLAAVITMSLGLVFTDLARLTGYGSEDAMLIAAAAPQVALRGLMLAGLMIGALGALTDITIVQAAVIRELAHVDPSASVRKLYVHGMNVGRDHVGSLVNTLVLAYTGAALPLLVLLSHGDFGFARSLNLELIAAEVVHTLVGSVGLILAVPVTTLIAAAMFRGDRLPIAPGELDHAHSH
ncbi:MAG: YibE/F family protein [Trueperaceae bacterium]